MSAPPRRLTAEEFAALPNDGLRLELIQGELVAMAPSFGDHSHIAGRVASLLGGYVLAHGLGDIYAAEGGFLLSRNPDTVRAPDVAFIQAARMSPAATSARWIEVVPDLVAEVVSSGDRCTEVAAKVQIWLDAGVPLVWVIWPAKQIVEVHQPNQPMITLGMSDQLDGGAVVPGFSAPVSRLLA